MVEIKETHEIYIPDKLPSADTSHTPPPAYSNHIRLSLTENELILDFYQILISRVQPGSIDLSLIHRLIVPSGNAKGLAEALVNVIVNTEQQQNIKLPLQRESQPGDRVQLWDLLSKQEQEKRAQE